jgi:hypothetical protein
LNALSLKDDSRLDPVADGVDILYDSNLTSIARLRLLLWLLEDTANYPSTTLKPLSDTMFVHIIDMLRRDL